MKFLQRVEYRRPSGFVCVDWNSIADMIAGDERWRLSYVRNGLSFFWGVANAVKAVEMFRAEGMYPVWGGR